MVTDEIGGRNIIEAVVPQASYDKGEEGPATPKWSAEPDDMARITALECVESFPT
jgi:hypothetical protein